MSSKARLWVFVQVQRLSFEEPFALQVPTSFRNREIIILSRKPFVPRRVRNVLNVPYRPSPYSIGYKKDCTEGHGVVLSWEAFGASCPRQNMCKPKRLVPRWHDTLNVGNDSRRSQFHHVLLRSGLKCLPLSYRGLTPASCGAHFRCIHLMSGQNRL